LFLQFFDLLVQIRRGWTIVTRVVVLILQKFADRRSGQIGRAVRPLDHAQFNQPFMLVFGQA
jgi:hypothetical protein